jgi:hypothetical protein
MQTEALCMALQRTTVSANFLRRLDPALDVEKVSRAERFRQASALLWLLLFTELERHIYEHPEADPAYAYARLVSEYFGVSIAPEHASWDSEHLLNGVYLQNYVLGMVLAEDLSRRNLSGPELGRRFRDAMATGRAHSFEALAEKLLGEPLSEKAASGLHGP